MLLPQLQNKIWAKIIENAQVESEGGKAPSQRYTHMKIAPRELLDRDLIHNKSCTKLEERVCHWCGNRACVRLVGRPNGRPISRQPAAPNITHSQVAKRRDNPLYMRNPVANSLPTVATMRIRFPHGDNLFVSSRGAIIELICGKINQGERC